MKVILVEDHLPSRKLASVLLRSRGHEVAEAGTLEEALEQLARGTPDVVVSDIEFPGGGGQALVARIRSSSGLASVPIVAVTARAMAGERELILAAGFDGYVSKPLNGTDFVALVERLAAKKRTA